MGTRAIMRQRLAVGVAGALLVSALVGNLAPVGAADADAGPTTQERDVNIGKEATGLADEGHYTITSVTVPAIVVDAPLAAPDPALPIENGRDGRD